MNDKIKFTRVNSDVYGNPRYVCHFLELVNDNDREKVKDMGINFISELYSIAVKKANKIGGRKYHNKSYGGGIVFQSYNTDDLSNKIQQINAD
jgi:hypothetical protein